MADGTRTHDALQESGGSKELARSASAWFACLTFAITFLVATLAGSGPSTAFVRGGIGAFLAHRIGLWLFVPAVGAVLAAMARDRAVREPAQAGASEAEAGGNA